MVEDLLRRIQREMNERLGELHGAVVEHDRLAAELKRLQNVPGPPAERDPGAGPQLCVIPGCTPLNVRRSPAARSLPRPPMVSRKVTRLMCSQPGPALERPGVPRSSAKAHRPPKDDLAAAVDLFPGGDPHLALDEVDAEAERYERSL